MEKPFVMDLAKLVIAAAWADGELSNDEVNALKDLLFAVPDMSGEDWLSLEIYMDSPVSVDERERLLSAVVDRIRTSEEKQLVLDQLTKLMEADGEVTAEEAQVVSQIEEDVREASTGLLAHLKQAIRGAVRKRSAHVGEDANREARLQDFIKNRVYYRLAAEVDMRGKCLSMEDGQVRKICLAAGLMAKVAWLDREVSQEESRHIQDTLEREFGAPSVVAGLLTEISLDSAVRGLDTVRLTRNIFQRTNQEERGAIVRCLFTIANAAGKTSFEEIKKIELIAKGLKLSHREFIEAKLTIPRKDRGGL